MAAPGPVAKRLLRAPIALYDIGAGWLLGRRFLLLTHRGRRSGRRYRTMLEVVAWNPATEEATVISGFGAKANWYLNALGGGAEEIRISRDRFRPAVRRVEGEEATRIVADYEHRNRLAKPLVRAVLARLAGHAYDGSEEARRKLIDELPLVAFSRSQDQLAEAG